MTLRPSQKRIARYAELRTTAPMKKVNRKRKASAFERCYHSVERVEFVKALHCLVDGCESTESENAHVCDDGSKGGSRKSGYACIAPACGEHHHEMDDVIGKEKFEEKYGVDLALEAAKCQRTWLRYSGEEE